MAAKQIKVTVSGKGPLKRYVNGEDIFVPHGSTVSVLVSRCRIPEGHKVICMKDGKRMTPSARLHEGDCVIMISMISGG